MAITNIRTTGAGTFRATTDSVSGPHQFGLNGTNPDTLAEAQTRNGALPPGQELVGVHHNAEGLSFHLATVGEQTHVIATQRPTSKSLGTKDSAGFDDLALNFKAGVALNKIRQQKQDEYWAKPAHLR